MRGDGKRDRIARAGICDASTSSARGGCNASNGLTKALHLNAAGYVDVPSRHRFVLLPDATAPRRHIKRAIKTDLVSRRFKRRYGNCDVQRAYIRCSSPHNTRLNLL